MDILDQIITATSYYATDQWLRSSPDELSAQRVKLAAYYAYLGEEYSKARQEAEQAEFDAKLAENATYLRMRQAVATQVDAKEQAKFENMEKFQIALTKQSIAKRLQLLLNGLNELLNSLGSRLRVLESERANTPQ